MSSIYSIGHGQKSKEEFISELQSFGIEYLIDVRTSPYSKWAPHFNSGIIDQWLKSVGIRYLYMGDSIGGRPLNDSYYDSEGFFDYRLMAENPIFINGLNRLVKADSANCIVAVMCSESNPAECHRSKLIGRELYFKHNISMYHIIGINKFVSQPQIMTELTKGSWQQEGGLFGDYEQPYFRSRKAYKLDDYETEIVAEEGLPYD